MVQLPSPQGQQSDLAAVRLKTTLPRDGHEKNMHSPRSTVKQSETSPNYTEKAVHYVLIQDRH